MAFRTEGSASWVMCREFQNCDGVSLLACFTRAVSDHIHTVVGGNAKAAVSLDELFEFIPLDGGDAPVWLGIAIPSRHLTSLPGFPEAALPQSGRVASGRGFTSALARASALGEAAELVSCCAWGDEALIVATADELGPAALLPEALNGFSDWQIAQRHDWNRRYGEYDWRPMPCGPTTPIAWLEVEDAFVGTQAYVPADFAFVGRKEAGNENAVAIGDSNGCAAGPTIETAKLAAILELVERDATGQWWYRGQGRAPIVLTSLKIETGLVSWLQGRQRRSWLYDITNDIGVPVFAAVSAEEGGRDVVLGFAARVESHAAAIAALSEMLQMEVSLKAARAMGEAAGNWTQWRAQVSLATPPLDGKSKLAPSQIEASRLPEASSQLAVALEACARNGIDLHFCDMTRSAIGIPVVRAMSAALCHYKPRFNRTRLLAGTPNNIVPIARGNTNQIPLLI